MPIFLCRKVVTRRDWTNLTRFLLNSSVTHGASEPEILTSSIRKVFLGVFRKKFKVLRWAENSKGKIQKPICFFRELWCEVFFPEALLWVRKAIKVPTNLLVPMARCLSLSSPGANVFMLTGCCWNAVKTKII